MNFLGIWQALPKYVLTVGAFCSLRRNMRARSLQDLSEMKGLEGLPAFSGLPSKPQDLHSPGLKLPAEQDLCHKGD